MKTFIRFMSVMLIAFFTAVAVQAAPAFLHTELPSFITPASVFFGSIGLSVILSIAPIQIPGTAFMALQKELWTGELIKHFRHDAVFLSRIASRNNYVQNNAIHLVDLGADPNVLINNTTYPINSVGRTDEDVVISLDKFDTENTIITDDELYALPYDKPGSVIEQHRAVLEERTSEKAAHSLCPQAATGDTPVVFTSGASNGETNARKRMTVSDIANAKRFLDNLKVPLVGRELVLSSLHVWDLLLTEQRFKDQWYNIQNGQPVNMFGFTVRLLLSRN